jgi:hypothetical protein
LRRRKIGKRLTHDNVAVIENLKQRTIEASPERIAARQVDHEWQAARGR